MCMGRSPAPSRAPAPGRSQPRGQVRQLRDSLSTLVRQDWRSSCCIGRLLMPCGAIACGGATSLARVAGKWEGALRLAGRASRAQARAAGCRRSGQRARLDHMGRPDQGRGVSHRERRRWHNFPKAFSLARANQTRSRPSRSKTKDTPHPVMSDPRSSTLGRVLDLDLRRRTSSGPARYPH
jgi:hypothetical protein